MHARKPAHAHVCVHTCACARVRVCTSASAYMSGGTLSGKGGPTVLQGVPLTQRNVAKFARTRQEA